MQRRGHATWTGLALALFAGAACTGPHKLISARHIPCATRKVEISDFRAGADREDWIARCGAERYACTTREKGRRLIYACKPLARDAGAGTLASDAAVPSDAGPAGDAGPAQ